MSCRAAVSSVASGTLSVRPTVVVSDRVSSASAPNSTSRVRGQPPSAVNIEGNTCAAGSQVRRRSDRSTATRPTSTSAVATASAADLTEACDSSPLNLSTYESASRRTEFGRQPGQALEARHRARSGPLGTRRTAIARPRRSISPAPLMC